MGNVFGIKANAKMAEITQQVRSDRPSAGISIIGSLLSKMESPVINVLGDSTSAETTCFPYQIGLKIKELCPDINVKYALYDWTNQVYGAFVDINNAGEERHLRYDGTGTYIWQMPVGEVPLTSTDLDVRIRVSIDNWMDSTSRYFIGRWQGSGARVFALYLDTANKFCFGWTVDGSAIITQNSNKTPTQLGFTNGTPYWIRATMDVDDGSGHYVLKLYWSTTGTSWVEFFSVTGASTTSFYASATNPYEIGGFWTNGGKIVGKIFAVDIRDGIDGAMVMPQPIEAWQSYPTDNDFYGHFAGTPTVYIYNGSVVGNGMTQYVDSAVLGKMIIPAYSPLVIFNIGHNDRGRDGKEYTASWDTLITYVTGHTIIPNMVLVTQNPKISPALHIIQGANRRRHLCGYGANKNISVIDTYTAFYEDGRPLTTLLQADGLHPSFDGQALMADVIWKQLNML